VSTSSSFITPLFCKLPNTCSVSDPEPSPAPALLPYLLTLFLSFSMLCRKNLPLYMRAVRYAAVSIVALREGFRAIESFLEEDILSKAAGDVSEGGQSVEQESKGVRVQRLMNEIDGCACKAAFLRFVMWSLNRNVFFTSGNLLVDHTRKEFTSMMGSDRAESLINLVEKAADSSISERSLIMRSTCAMWSLWTSACVMPRTWPCQPSSDSPCSDDNTDEPQVEYEDLQRLLPMDSCMVVTAFRAYSNLDLPLPPMADASREALLSVKPQLSGGIGGFSDRADGEDLHSEDEDVSEHGGDNVHHSIQGGVGGDGVDCNDWDDFETSTIDGMKDDYYNTGMFSRVFGDEGWASETWDICWDLLESQEQGTGDCTPSTLGKPVEAEQSPRVQGCLPVPPIQSLLSIMGQFSVAASLPSSSRQPRASSASSAISRAVDVMFGTGKCPGTSNQGGIDQDNCKAEGRQEANPPLCSPSAPMTAFVKYKKEFSILKPFMAHVGIHLAAMVGSNHNYLQVQRADFLRAMKGRTCNGGAKCTCASTEEVPGSSVKRSRRK